MTCRQCDGEKTVFALVHRTSGCTAERMPCSLCKGTGLDPNHPAEWAVAGMELRLRRRARDLSMGEAARRMGVRTSELSDAELGYRDPTPFLTALDIEVEP